MSGAAGGSGDARGGGGFDADAGGVQQPGPGAPQPVASTAAGLSDEQLKRLGASNW